MHQSSGTPLSRFTTLRTGGPAKRLVEATTSDEVVTAVTAADQAGEPVLILGGGSNVVISDAGFEGTVVLLRSQGMHVTADDAMAEVTVAAGERWDELVQIAVAESWSGVEALSGIPGLVGGGPIQNIGAYGQQISTMISRVTVLDRQSGQVRTMLPAQCHFNYRHSVFKGTDRYVVLDVTLVLEVSPTSQPLGYAELADVLGAELGQRVPLAAVREAVLGLRRAKGMVLDLADPDSVSVGSFFTNVILDAASFAELERRVGPNVELPRYPQPEGRMKVSAAWLIERAGFGKGYGTGPAGLSTKHTLALINRGNAKTKDVLGLARKIRDGVRERFGVELVPEPILVGVTL